MKAASNSGAGDCVVAAGFRRETSNIQRRMQISETANYKGGSSEGRLRNLKPKKIANRPNTIA